MWPIKGNWFWFTWEIDDSYPWFSNYMMSILFTTLANLTLIILLSRMLKFSEIISSKSKNIVKKNSEYLGIFSKMLKFPKQSQSLITSLGWWKCSWMCTLHPGQFSYSVAWSKTKYLLGKKNLYLNMNCPWCLQHRCSHSKKCIETSRQFQFIDTQYSVAHSGLAENPYLHDPASWS